MILFKLSACIVVIILTIYQHNNLTMIYIFIRPGNTIFQALIKQAHWSSEHALSVHTRSDWLFESFLITHITHGQSLIRTVKQHVTVRNQYLHVCTDASTYNNSQNSMGDIWSPVEHKTNTYNIMCNISHTTARSADYSMQCTNAFT